MRGGVGVTTCACEECGCEVELSSDIDGVDSTVCIECQVGDHYGVDDVNYGIPDA
jgi:hypothetical protein